MGEVIESQGVGGRGKSRYASCTLEKRWNCGVLGRFFRFFKRIF